MKLSDWIQGLNRGAIQIYQIDQDEDRLNQGSIVLHWAFPNGVPDAERAFLTTLTPERRSRLFSRLEALRQAEAPGADMVAIGKTIDLGRSGLFDLRRRWNAERHLSTVAVRSVPAGLKRQRGDASSLSAPTARRRQREIDRQAALTPVRLLRDFGRYFALDLSAVDMIMESRARPVWACMAALVERSSGYILAATVSPTDVIPDIVGALNAGRTEAWFRHLAVPGQPEFTFVAPEYPADDPQRAMRELRSIENIDGVDLVTRKRRFGSAIIPSIGERVGTLKILPRILPDHPEPTAGLMKGRVVVSPADAASRLSVEIFRHNQPIIGRLVGLGLMDARGDPQPLLSILERSIKALAGVDPESLPAH